MRRERTLLVVFIVAVATAIWFGYAAPGSEGYYLVPIDYNPFLPFWDV